MKNDFISDSDYQQWLGNLKRDFVAFQNKAGLQVNTVLLQFYWKLGCQILEKQRTSNYGDGLMKQLSKDLMASFPATAGFSPSNIAYIRRWVLFYQQDEILPQAVVKLQLFDSQHIMMPEMVGLIPWGHNREIITRCATKVEAFFYVNATIKNNWSRAVLISQIESKLYTRNGASINNFDYTLASPQSDLAKEILKSPYNFEFLTIEEETREKDLERGLVNQIQEFLLELGQGFAFMGRQYHLRVGKSDFYLDLLFYHVRLKAYCVVELKTGAFQPEFAGKLNFYLNAVDAQLKGKEDNPTIGMLLCKTPDSVVVDYSIKTIDTPLSVAEYRLTNVIPDNLKHKLPSTEDFQKGLSGNGGV